MCNKLIIEDHVIALYFSYIQTIFRFITTTNNIKWDIDIKNIVMQFH